MAEYIDASFELGANYIMLRVLEAKDSTVKLINTANTCFLIVVVAWYFVAYLPLIKQMDATVKRSRAMLLFFPREVVRSVPCIRDVMKAYSVSVM